MQSLNINFPLSSILKAKITKRVKYFASENKRHSLIVYRDKNILLILRQLSFNKVI